METNPRFVGLEQHTRANVDRSAFLIKKAKALIERRKAARKSQIKLWLLSTASVIRDWSTMPKEEIDSTMAEATPAEAAAYIVDRHVPTDLRADLLRTLPSLSQYSFHHAAWQIRHAAAFQHLG